jgi:nitrogen fixation protein NifZ
MQYKFEYGQEVRVTRNVRNDGTYAGLEVGAPLVKRGSTGFIRSIGTFLQDQIIYGIHFLAEDKVVGCREEELLAADEPWVPSKYEFRDKVSSNKMLAVSGEVIVNIGDVGEVIKVVRDHPADVHYHVYFTGHMLMVPEASLDPIEVADKDE